uniref:CUB domain containing protein 1a n=1 Tax=Seriola lalandi dorsalis TaxID=1841481 RepID=A0A3B4YT54_SERLL
MVLTVDSSTTVVFTRDPKGPECEVCTVDGSTPNCNPTEKRLSNAEKHSLEFSCPKPQDMYSVKIKKKIDCTETSCSGNIVQAESSMFPDFNRTFTWDLKVVSTRAFQLAFQETGMRQIPNEETCPDEHTYSLVTYLRTGPATIGTFCKGGTVTTILARYKGRVSLRVPGDTNAYVSANMASFKFFCVSDTDFITANYPRDFPDNQQMQWDFMVPGMHNYTMHFRDHTAPECLSSEVEVEYKKENKKVTKLTLTDPQPEHQQGNFNMVLKNCETNRTIQGLALKYRVSVMRSGHPAQVRMNTQMMPPCCIFFSVLCTVDLTKQQGVSLQIEKVGSDPYCEMSINSKVEKKINIAAGTKASLSFLDCPNEDVRCQNVASCPSTLLTVPKLDSCLPMSLHSFTWHLNIPQDGTVDLVSPTGSLQQSIPGQKCDQSVSLRVSEEDGFSVGDFCFNGTIQKVQVHANVSITATAQNFTRTRGPFLNASFSQEIPVPTLSIISIPFSETIIYRVNPGILSPTLLATPNWPQGMKPSSTMSWIVTVPSHYQAHVQFVNVSQPKCLERHTAIIVKMLGYEEELMSRREDEQAEDKLLIPQSFYLNMSNCIPEEGHFGAVTKIVLQRKTNVLAIILGIVGALLLMLIVKKKKERTNKEASIYIGKGSFFRPGDKHFTKTRPENNSHVYDSIDEMMVYGHLLGETSYADSMQDHFTGMQADSYNTFTGPTDGQLPVIKEPDPEPKTDQYKTFLDPSETFIPSRPRTPIDREA